MTIRKRDKLCNFFLFGEHGAKVKTLSPGLPNASNDRAAVFTRNLGRPASNITLPELGGRIEKTPQLVLCLSLLAKDVLSPPSATQNLSAFSDDEKVWIKAIAQEPVEQSRIFWLAHRLVEEFAKDAVKGSAAIAEVVLLGPALDREYYRKLLSCFMVAFEQSRILDIDLLHGLVQLVEGASEEYLLADDLVRILAMLRERLQVTHEQSPGHPYHLTAAVSRILDVMADRKVQDVNRVLEHEPLSEILSGLKGSSDPFLMYQASYAFQALQYVPDDETALQAILRHSMGVADSLVKVSGVLKLDLGSVLLGLEGLQVAISGIYDNAKTGYSGVCSLMESGRGVFDSFKEGLGSGYRRPWYPTLRAADHFVRQGQLADLNRLIVEAPCRRDPLFQWGISQLLAEIAVDVTWDIGIRKMAIDLLVDLYKNDVDWARDKDVQSWMLKVVDQLRLTPDTAIKEHASALMKKKGGSTTRSFYPLGSPLPKPAASPMLSRVQEIPTVEYTIHQLRMRRLQEGTQPVYIPPMAKAGLENEGIDLFPLMEKVKEFLTGDRQVMLILGDSGAGKSTFNRHLECELLKAYNCGEPIPLFINLPGLERPEKELITEQLQAHSFSEAQIQELKHHRQFIVVCDGYDESQLITNLHTTNLLNRPGQWKAKLVISCRSQYLGQDYDHRFVPQETGHYSSPALHLFQEAVIAPFSKSQIRDYVEQYVPLEPRPWRTKDYMKHLTGIPNLMDLVANPFLLTLALGALPSVVKDMDTVSPVGMTRVALYDGFVEHWIGANKRRLLDQRLEQDSRNALAELLEDGFERNGIQYQKNLAAAIFREQDGKPFVDYTHKRDKSSWKAQFFGPESEPTLLRACSLLHRTGQQYRFIHRSVLEYFYSRFFYDPSSNDRKSDLQTSPLGVMTVLQPISGHRLSQRNLADEPSIIQFLSERVKQDVFYKAHLLSIIELSKTDRKASRAASNAITILVRAKVSFSGADLRGIRIPGADLTGGEFDSAQLQAANLKQARLRNVWLRQADLSRAKLKGVNFCESPYLVQRSGVQCCVYSPDGAVCAMGLCNYDIKLHNTKTWKEVATLQGHSDMVVIVVYSPTGKHIASGSDDRTVRLWDPLESSAIAVFRGHTGRVECMVYSPRGDLIASGSADKTVRLWNTRTLQPGSILRGHDNVVMSVMFSPNGDHIASGSYDNTVRIWSAHDGSPVHTLSQHTACVKSVVYSPDGKHIASASYDKTVRIWDCSSGAFVKTLSHEGMVTSVAYSPNGLQIAAGYNTLVQLWDAKSGKKVHLLSGHTDDVTRVVYSPSGHQIASSSHDKTVRLWDTQTGAPGPILSGHVNNIAGMAFSPNGVQLVTFSLDKTVRCWDVPEDDDMAGKKSSEPRQRGATTENDNTERFHNSRDGGHTDRVTTVTCSPNGKIIASGSFDRTVQLWNPQTGVLGKTWTGNIGRIECLTYSPSGTQIALASEDTFVYILDLETGGLIHKLEGHVSCVTSLAYSPDGKVVVSGGDDWGVFFWDAEKGIELRRLVLHKGSVTDVAYSPCGKQIASGSSDKTVILLDAATGEAVKTLAGHTGMVTSVFYSPNGKWIASGSNDKTIRLWNTLTGEHTVLEGHTDKVRSVAFSPSGEEIASGSIDSSVRLWEVASGKLLAKVEVFQSPVRSIAWVKNGLDRDGPNQNDLGNNGFHNFLAAGSDDRSVRVWRVNKTGSIYQMQLHWTSTHDRLVVSGANFVKSHNLSGINMKLMEQRHANAKGKSSREFEEHPHKKTQGMNLRVALTVTTAIGKMRTPDRKELDNSSNANASLPTPLQE